jgi:hypothetical protein
MFTKVHPADFIEEFENSQYRDNFSRAGLATLFDYLEKLEVEKNKPEELNPGLICSQFEEYNSFESFLTDHGGNFDTLEQLMRHTDVFLSIPYNPVYDSNKTGFIIDKF